MPLLINDRKIVHIDGVEGFVKEFGSQFKESSLLLLRQEVQVIGPEHLLYVGQREVAGTSPSDSVISLLGSEDATTCHIGVLRHSGSGATSLIHFDGSSISQGFELMVDIVKKLTKKTDVGRFEFHLVGGFMDNKGNSHEVSDKVLDTLCKCPHDIHLLTACITHLNTVFKNNVPFPEIYGIACDVKTGNVFRATFPDKGPDMSLRGARHFGGCEENISIYDASSQHLVIEPFQYNQLENIEQLVQLPNSFIRKYLSTSPEQEPEGFEDNVRSSLRCIQSFPDPINSVFKGKPRRYGKNVESGKWIQL